MCFRAELFVVLVVRPADPFLQDESTGSVGKGDDQSVEVLAEGLVNEGECDFPRLLLVNRFCDAMK